MELLKIALVLTVCCSSLYSVKSHTLHFGKCPTLEPISEFSMDKLLGKWYAIQKTSTSSRCLEYNFETTDEPNSYKLDQISENSIINVAKSNNYHYVGSLKSDPALPSRMVVSFPLNVVGKSSFVIFATDYVNYAGIFTCQQIPLGNRHSVTILSRSKTLDKQYLDKVRNRIASSNVNPFDLTIVDQNNCAHINTSTRVEINDQTFSSQNIGQAVRKVGSKIGDGIEYVIEGGKKIYKSASKSDTPDSDVEWMP